MLNIDLFLLGMVGSANLIIGVVVILSNKKSTTNRLFFLQTIILTAWSTVNYLSYQPHNPTTSLLLVRAVLFLGIPNSVNFLLLMHTFPSETIKINNKTLWSITTITIITMLFTLSPFVFSDIQIVQGAAPVPIVAPGIIAFLILAILPIFLGIYYLVLHYYRSVGDQRKQFLLLLLGITAMFGLIFLFALVWPVFLHNSRFIPLSAVFTFPFVALTAYSIYKHKLFNIKIAATVILAIFVTIFSFVNIIFSQELVSIIINATAFIIILLGSIRLIRDMLRLEEANEKLRELDKQKSEFVSFASHQLRSPLTAIKGYASLILEGAYGETKPDLKEAVQRVFDSSSTLAHVVDDYLNISRIELHSMKYNFVDIDLRDLVQTIIGELKPNIEKSNLKLTFNVFNNDSYMISADPDKFKQVIANLIDNSIKYTPKGSVTVTLERHDAMLHLSIKDTGIGMSPQIIPKLFEKFTRANNANQTNIRGTGLGLYVAKEIVTAHNGRVWAESPGEGKGSTFNVEVPLKTGAQLLKTTEKK